MRYVVDAGADLADRLGWASTYDAEYVALTQLQADALVTRDATLARALRGVVAVASVDELASAPRPSRRAGKRTRR
jgi:predicted nucleic acid-binding protein